MARCSAILVTFLSLWGFSCVEIQAQSITAAADGTGTIITVEGETYHINGGTQAGANLFHSFQEFGLKTNEIANFLGNPRIINILGRVTGGEASIINGLIQVTGANSNLYLMNPAGIVFGSGASLNVGGDFVATTADKIGFEQGEFSATGSNNYAQLVGAPNQFAFVSEKPGTILNFGDLTTEKNVSLVAGTVLNQGKVVSTQGNVTIAAIPGQRRVKISQPGMLLSLEVDQEAAIAGIDPLDLPTLLTGTSTSALTQPSPSGRGLLPSPTGRRAGDEGGEMEYQLGDVLIAGQVSGQSVDLYAASQVTPTDPNLVTGETRVIRFSATGENPHQGVFIDRRADHPEALLYGVAAGTISQMIEPDENGIEKISSQLSMISNSVGELESVAIIAEGNEGNFWLGNQWITHENIGDYQTQLQSWRNSLTENADILLYSCFTALGATGEALMSSIADMTGADVAASINATGSANYNGDWLLESNTGAIEAGNPFTAATLETWDGKLATFTVMGSSEALLDAAILAANLAPGADEIRFAPGVTTINLTLPLTLITDDLTITGDGTNVTIAGNGTMRIFEVTGGVTTTFDYLTLTGGVTAVNGGGILSDGTVNLSNSTVSGNIAAGSGAGIYSTGAINIANSTVSGNIASVAGGGISSTGAINIANSTVSGNTASVAGGGIYSTGNINLTNSTVSGNVSINGGGVNLDNTTGNLTVTNSTISGNAAAGAGGGIRSRGTVTLTNATIAFNTADADNSGAGNGGGLYIGGGTYNNSFVNSIIANNVDGSVGNEAPDINANLSTSTVQHNLITSTSGIIGSPLSNGVNGNIIGQDPLLGPLQNNGGTTATHALLSGSPAINAGNNGFTTMTMDQAGNLRIFDGTVDMGAYELPVETNSVDSVETDNASGLPICALTCSPLDLLELDILDESGSLFNIGVTELEIKLTSDYAEALELQLTGDYAGVTAADDISTLSVADIQQVLKDIEQQTGVQPALIYFTFIPSGLAGQAQQHETLIASTQADFWQGDLAQGLGSDLIRDDDELQLILVTPHGYPILKRPGVTRDRVTAQVRQFRRSLNSLSRRDRYLPPAQQLYDWLIRPLQPDLQDLGINNLAIIADEGLRSLPMSALHDGEHFLIHEYSVGLVPSLSLIDWRYSSLNEATILAMGASQFSTQSPLPAVPSELTLITQQYSGKSYLNEAFTHQNLKAQSHKRQFQILHLATHAAFRPESADAAYIQLWGQEELALQNLRDFKLYEDPPIELLVLSACETALGNANAELGFAGAALQAGVKSVLASLWQVSDLGTLALMDEFYRALADSDVTIKAEAIRQAQLSLLHRQDSSAGADLAQIALPSELARYRSTDLSHPYYWSAFTLVGSPW